MPACGRWPGTVMPACGRWPGTVMPACGRWPGTVMPAARRGYGYGSGSAVVDGMPVVPVQACQGSCAPAWAIGTVRQDG